MKFKSIIAYLLTVVFVISAVGCSKKDTTKQSSSKEYVAGVVKDNVYSSEYLNIKFTSPQDMTIMSHEQSVEATRQALEALGYSDSQIDQQQESESTEFACFNTDMINSANISVLKKPLSNNSPDEIIKKTVEELKGKGYITGENKYENDTIAGKKVVKTYLELNASGLKGKQLTCIGDMGDYVFSLNVCSFGKDPDKIISDILKCFEPLK